MDSIISGSMLFDESGNIKRPKISPLRKAAFKSRRGNVAFKCTFNDKKYREVCSKAIYELNIKKGRVWCKDDKNKCRNFVGQTPDENNFPCYECALFVNWQFSPGVGRQEENYNEPLLMREVLPNKLAILTTHHPRDDEEERHIFGFLHIGKVIDDQNDPTVSDAAQFVKGKRETSLELDSRVKLKFWDYYKNERTDRKLWGTGLFRYLSDETVLKILKALKKEYERIAPEKNDDIKIIDYHIERYELKE